MDRFLQQLARNQAGTSTIEFAIVAMLFLLLTFGLVDFGHMFWQYNSAAKAAQLGARLAAVSDPVWDGLPTFTDDAGTPGGAWQTNYSVTCTSSNASGSAGTCTGNNDGGYDAAAMQCLVFGRAAGGCDTQCAETGMDGEAGLCDRFNRITPQNVSITYSHTGLGFSGRPGGPVPTITLRLTGLTFNFVAVGTLAGLGQFMTMPDFRVTMTGEDLNRAAP
jgi:hypothetical protein